MSKFRYNDVGLNRAKIQQVFTALSADTLTCAVLVQQMHEDPLVVVFNHRMRTFTKLESLPKPQIPATPYLTLGPDSNPDMVPQYQLVLNYDGTELYISALNMESPIFFYKRVGVEWNLVSANRVLNQTGHLEVVNFHIVPEGPQQSLVLSLWHNRLSLYKVMKSAKRKNPSLYPENHAWLEGTPIALFVASPNHVVTLHAPNSLFRKAGLVIRHWAIDSGYSYTLSLKKEIVLALSPEFKTLGIAGPDDLENLHYSMVSDRDIICIGVRSMLYVLNYDGELVHRMQTKDTILRDCHTDEPSKINRLWITQSHVFCNMVSSVSAPYVEAFPVSALKEKESNPSNEVTTVINPFKPSFFPQDQQIQSNVHVRVSVDSAPNQLDLEFTLLKLEHQSPNLIDLKKPKMEQENKQAQPTNESILPEEFQKLSLEDLGESVNRAFKDCLDKQMMPCYASDEIKASYLKKAERQVSFAFNQWLDRHCSDPVKAVIIPNGVNPPSYMMVDSADLVKWDKYVKP